MPPFQSATTLLAEGVNLDVMTGRVTLFNVLEEVAAHTVPAFLPRVGVVNFYTFEPALTYPFFFDRVRILDPQGQQVIATIVPSRLAPVRPFFNSVHVLAGIRLNDYGDCYVISEYAEVETGPWIEFSRRRLIFVQTLAIPQPAPTPQTQH